jgi:hypothetical protein
MLSTHAKFVGLSLVCCLLGSVAFADPPTRVCISSFPCTLKTTTPCPNPEGYTVQTCVQQTKDCELQAEGPKCPEEIYETKQPAADVDAAEAASSGAPGVCTTDSYVVCWKRTKCSSCNSAFVNNALRLLCSKPLLPDWDEIGKYYLYEEITGSCSGSGGLQ